MQPYQQQYIDNTTEISALSDFYAVPTDGFETWYAEQKRRSARIKALRQQNMELLGEHLFPALDALHAASEETIDELIAFADKLMDWKTNLDCGVYVQIHDALLRMYRVRRDRNRIIRELYKLGMGLYYQNRIIEGVGSKYIASYRFRNEMIFTEAGSYLKYFAEIEDSETRGYIIRALANIAICSNDRKRRIAVTKRVLQICRDDYYRNLEPLLPWDVFVRRSNQQMSANRTTLSRGDLTTQELEAVFESCYEVFKPEDGVQNPDVRWLWPYYEMEFSCGFVDLETTLERLEHIVEGMDASDYSVSGLYGNVQLPIYYGRLLRSNPGAKNRAKHEQVLARIYRRMMHTPMHCPLDRDSDYLTYILRLVMSGYYEIKDVPPLKDVALQMMQRFAGALMIRSEQIAAVMRLYAGTLFDSDPTFYDDVDWIASIADPVEKRETVVRFAGECGLYHDLGRIEMNVTRMTSVRSLFEVEDSMIRLHTIAGHTELMERPSTAIYADAAFGHHSWYNGAGGYPEQYVRNVSPYRQMTDTLAVVSYLCDQYDGDLDAVIRDIAAQEHKRFSPLVTVHLGDPALHAQLERILSDDAPFYRAFYDRMTAPQSDE